MTSSATILPHERLNIQGHGSFTSSTGVFSNIDQSLLSFPYHSRYFEEILSVWCSERRSLDLGVLFVEAMTCLCRTLRPDSDNRGSESIDLQTQGHADFPGATFLSNRLH
jgi:hypothetical protein